MITIPLNALMTAARVLIQADATVEEAEAALVTAKARARLLREETIPNAMMELGLTRLDLDSGEVLKVVHDVFASIPVAKRDAAFEWLVAHQHEGLIKTEVAASFGKGQWKQAVKIQALLIKKGLEATCEQSVHPSTLKAFLKEQLGDGKEVPLELFGAMSVFTTKITVPKTKGV